MCIFDTTNKTNRIMRAIITSLLETDLYKFSMGQAIFHQFPSYKTTWTFKCRNKDVKFTSEMVAEIKHQLQAYCQLSFTEEELDYLRSIGARKDEKGNIVRKGWIKDSYIDLSKNNDDLILLHIYHSQKVHYQYISYLNCFNFWHLMW